MSTTEPTETMTTEQKILHAVRLAGRAITSRENAQVVDAIRAIVDARGALSPTADEHDALAALCAAVCAAGKKKAA